MLSAVSLIIMLVRPFCIAIGVFCDGSYCIRCWQCRMYVGRVHSWGWLLRIAWLKEGLWTTHNVMSSRYQNLGSMHVEIKNFLQLHCTVHTSCTSIGHTSISYGCKSIVTYTLSCAGWVKLTSAISATPKSSTWVICKHGWNLYSSGLTSRTFTNYTDGKCQKRSRLRLLLCIR